MSLRWFPPVLKGAGGLLLVVIVLLAAPAPAYAHAQLLSTTPANGARLAIAPDEIVLRFSERMNLVRDGVVVLDARGPVRGVGPARLGAPAEVVVPLPDGLGPGLYTVSWRVVSADSHPIHGAFAFGIGDVQVGPLADAGARTDADRPLSTVFWFFRWLGYAALALLAGGAVFLAVCWPAGATQPRARRLLRIGWLGSAVSAVAVLLLQGPYAAGGTLSRIADPALSAATLGTDYGRYVLARLVLLLVGGAALLVVSWRWTSAAVLGLGLPVTWVGTGHANAADLLPAAADTAHLAAMAAWFGGLAFLVYCVLSRPVDEVTTAVTRFSRTATIAVAVLVVSGTYQAWRGVGSLAALAGSDYGKLLVFKLAAIGILLWFGAMSRSVVRRRYVRPALVAMAATAAPTGAARAATAAAKGAARAGRADRRAERADRDQELLARRRLRSSVRVEVLIGVAVLALTAMLVATPPGARPEPAVAGDTAPAVFSRALILPNGGAAEVRLDPARVGPTELMLVVRGPGGVSWDVPEVSASVTLPAKGIGPLRANLVRTGPGEYASQGLSLPMAGAWRLLVKVRTTEVDQISVETELDIPQ